jgi:hypothetical protein
VFARTHIHLHIYILTCVFVYVCMQEIKISAQQGNAFGRGENVDVSCAIDTSRSTDLKVSVTKPYMLGCVRVCVRVWVCECHVHECTRKSV